MFVEICKPTLFTFGLPLYWFLSLNYRWVEYETGQYRSVDSNQSLVTGFMTTAGISGSSTMSSAVKYKSTERSLKHSGLMLKIVNKQFHVLDFLDAWLLGCFVFSSSY